MILSMILETDKIFGKRSLAREKQKKITRTIYQIDQMSSKDWKKFREIMDELAESSEIIKEFNSRFKDQR